MKINIVWANGDKETVQYHGDPLEDRVLEWDEWIILFGYGTEVKRALNLKHAREVSLEE